MTFILARKNLGPGFTYISATGFTTRKRSEARVYRTREDAERARDFQNSVACVASYEILSDN